MLRRLLEYEVPEIYNGLVEIKSIAREPGARSKVAVAALQEGIDPVGACVGMRGGRIQNIVKELHDEKIDVIEWSANQEQFIAKALSPARVTGVYLEDDPDSGRTAVVIVPDDQLSLAIGKEGQNARLAAKLTGWRIDIKSVAEAVQEALDNLDTPALRELRTAHSDLIAEAERILEKKTLNRTIQPEEFALLGKLADLVQRRLVAGREVVRKKRMAEINAVKATLPPGAFHMAVDALDLPEEIRAALKPLGSAGDVMLLALVNEGRIRQRISQFGDDALTLVQDALARLIIPAEIEAAAKAEASEEAVVSAETEAQPVTVEDEGEAPDAFPDLPEPVAEIAPPKPTSRYVPQRPAVPAVDIDAFDDDEAEEPDLAAKGPKAGKGKKGKKKGRQIVYDESRGSTYVKRERKGGRSPRDWSSFGDWDET